MDDAIYLDHAATSFPKPRPVIEAVSAALESLGSPGRGAHSVGLATSRAIFEARERVAGFLGVADSRNLLFLPGCTYALNVALKGLLREGDRVLVSSMEHNAVVRPLAALKKAGVGVEVVQAAPDGSLDPSGFERALAAAPARAVVCQHVSNATGTIAPVAEIAAVARAAGALMIVDGAQAVGHLGVDVGRLGVDAYAASGHKGLLGPQGVGILYLSPGVEPDELLQGGTGSLSESEDMPQDRPSRYESGTPNTPGIVGLGAGVAYLARHGEAIREREAALAEALASGLADIPGVHILGPRAGAERAPIVSFVHDSVDPDKIAFRLDRDHGIAVRSGLHCAPWAHRSIGTIDTGAVRASVGWSTTEAEIDAAVAAVREVIS